MKTIKRKKKDTPYLDRYEAWMETGFLPRQNGLCNEFGVCVDFEFKFDKHPYFTLFVPTDEMCHDYWAKEDSIASIADLGMPFSPIRQNIVLLMSQMNNEY